MQTRREKTGCYVFRRLVLKTLDFLLQHAHCQSNCVPLIWNQGGADGGVDKMISEIFLTIRCSPNKAPSKEPMQLLTLAVQSTHYVITQLFIAFIATTHTCIEPGNLGNISSPTQFRSLSIWSTKITPHRTDKGTLVMATPNSSFDGLHTEVLKQLQQKFQKETVSREMHAFCHLCPAGSPAATDLINLDRGHLLQWSKACEAAINQWCCCRRDYKATPDAPSFTTRNTTLSKKVLFVFVYSIVLILSFSGENERWALCYHQKKCRGLSRGAYLFLQLG